MENKNEPKLIKQNTGEATESTSPNPSTGEFTIFDGNIYNNKGYIICGVLNQHNKPCQRIGKCPFHDKDDKKPNEKDFPKNLKVKTSKKKVKKKPYKKGWTKDEHFRFLTGLKIHGKGAWKEIANIVKTRTPIQIQSHAQKYFKRQKQEKKSKKSIHDYTLSDMKNYQNQISMGETFKTAGMDFKPNPFANQNSPPLDLTKFVSYFQNSIIHADPEEPPHFPPDINYSPPGINSRPPPPPQNPPQQQNQPPPPPQNQQQIQQQPQRYVIKGDERVFSNQIYSNDKQMYKKPIKDLNGIKYVYQAGNPEMYQQDYIPIPSHHIRELAPIRQFQQPPPLSRINVRRANIPTHHTRIVQSPIREEHIRNENITNLNISDEVENLELPALEKDNEKNDDSSSPLSNEENDDQSLLKKRKRDDDKYNSETEFDHIMNIKRQKL